MVDRGTTGRQVVRRFARWGLIHGPVWGAMAALLTLPLAAFLDLRAGPAEVAMSGIAAGLLAGPVIGVIVGLVCVAAERAPNWLLDAPDYVAVLTVVGTVGVITWPILRLDRVGVLGGIAFVAVICAAPAVDAATSVPGLLHLDGPPDGQAS